MKLILQLQNILLGWLKSILVGAHDCASNMYVPSRLDLLVEKFHNMPLAETTPLVEITPLAETMTSMCYTCVGFPVMEHLGTNEFE